ncbi:MAG: 1-deoxy-D-xylulose-5-phosphate synthase [Bacteroidales bacterium]|jgi:1-deoxy-D-xylulose-5-phosphate synthase|nr:1-deoxy-D-xylulose-5-phosphate synthase [Bacteroidales bacterium]
MDRDHTIDQTGNLLERIHLPSDLKKLTTEEMLVLSSQLRQFIIDATSHNPGHLGANLGVVELAVALHYVFDTPNDKIIWDVGHQAYAHKILTGRKDNFHTNRKYGGLSGFPNPAESEYDAFGVGHSSTSISAALGIAVASKLENEKRQVVAVIGDGSLTGGMAFEALNHAGAERANMLVILNDNNMSIDPNVGALKEYLIDITTSYTYNKLKKEVWDIMHKHSRSRRMIQQIERGIKAVLMKQGNLFEALGFRYFGPVDGHDITYLTRILQDMKRIEGPKLLHVLTTKGKGYEFAEKDQTRWHAPGLFNKETGELIRVSTDQPQPPLYQEVFGQTLTQLAEKNDRIVGVTPAMSSGCSMSHLMKRFPDRFFDVGIAEQHAVTFSAGLAMQGLIPFCNIYSSFLQRAYDQVIHDVALQKLPVVLCIDRAGLVGEDGATHHGAYDLAYLRSIPNMVISAPMNEIQLRHLMYTAQNGKYGPFAIRYPRGHGVTTKWEEPFRELPVGKGKVVREGDDIAIVSIGTVGNSVIEACRKLEDEGVHAAHYDMIFLKPLDEELLHSICRKHRLLVTIEDGTVLGGLGSAVLEFANDHNYEVQVKRLGIPDRFVTHGTIQELQHECGYDVEGIVNTVKSILQRVVLSHVG